MFRPLQPLFVDEESGELAIDGYQPWFYPDNVVLAIGESHYMVLDEIIRAYEDEEISEAQAKLLESAFVLNSWTWADAPDRNLPTLQTMYTRQLLGKDDD